ncbi:MAG: Ig-like domain-containing protein [Fibrobacteraceae bacterium]|nr:Ig-like domain-containing protein [Fibrobacteraceae bacterium]
MKLIGVKNWHKLTWTALALFVCLSASFISCATQVAPGGGPEDKLPPRVAGVYPAPNTTNHPNELYVKLEFDEWINATIPRSAVSISPPIEKKLRFEVGGKNLELSSRAVLDDSTTYTITFAGGIKDLHGNSLAEPFHVVFSTGPVIDSLTLVGRVLVNDAMASAKSYPSIGLFLMGEERKSKRYLEKYRDTTTGVLDSLPLLTKEPPLFITRADSAGNFKLTGLRPGLYRVVAFVDANGNQKVEPSVELAGVWTRDLSLKDSTSDTLWVALADQDTSHLELESVSQPYSNVLEASFNRNVYFDSTFADTNNCYIESPEGKMTYPSMVYLGASSNKPNFYFSKKPKAEVLYKFLCKSGTDSSFRILDTLRNRVDWEWVDMKGDTLTPSIAKTLMRSKAKSAFPEDSLIFAYNKPVLDSLQETYYLAMNKDTNAVSIVQIDPIRYLVQNKEPWPTDATIDFLQGYQDTTLAKADSNGVRDTVVELKYKRLLRFETVSKLKLASLKGKIPGGTDKVVVRLRAIDTKKDYFAMCGVDGSVAFDNLMEGNYFIDYYYPKDGSNLPDAGGLNPFRYGKPWRAPKDTLKLANGENELEKLLPRSLSKISEEGK